MSDMLINAIRAQKTELAYLSSKNTVERAGKNALLKSLRSEMVKVITGPRRAGKSTLAIQTLNGAKFAYVNFEDNSFPQALDGDSIFEALEKVYGKVDYYLFDEIQNLDRWEEWINKLHRRGKNIIITGSNSKLLARELADSLTGRFISTELFPFSYKEFVGIPQNLRATANPDGDHFSQELFEKYLTHGGFPAVALNIGGEPRDYLKTLIDSIALNDIINRYRIRNSIEVGALITLLLNSAAAKFSARSLQRALNGALSVATIQKYLGYYNQAYLFEDLPRYFHKTRERLKADRKAYFIDNGFITSAGSAPASDRSRLLENAVFMELRRHGLRSGLELFYYVTKSGYEVDLVVNTNGRIRNLIQVTNSLEQQKTLERELRSLVQASDELKCDSLKILLGNGSAQNLKCEGRTIEVVPLKDWLLLENPLET